MHVSAELRGRRLATALLLVALVPASIGTAVAAYAAAGVTPGPPSYDPRPLPILDLDQAYQSRELDRSRRASSRAASLSGPTLLPAVFPDPLPTLVLAAREQPYTLAELAQLTPEAFEAQPDGGLLVKASVDVPTGSTLLVDSAQTPRVLLTSSPSGIAAVIARGGAIDLRGSATEQLRITSWDPATSAADSEPGDGRAFILTEGGRMDIQHADLGHLGFATGASSGVAWRGDVPSDGAEPVKATGTVTNSVFHDNWYGAYTFEAEGMRFADSVFANNAAYGFDPHDLSNNFVVERNVAFGNGRHGFIFSRGCDGNVLRDNVSFDNRGHGFMIDDGRTEDADYAAAAVLTSDDNVLERNHAYDNDGSGIEIEGGSGNVVRDNLLERNHVGVRVKDDAVAEVVDNTITDSRLFGVHVFEDSAGSAVRDNTITGGWGGIGTSSAAEVQMAGNEIDDAYATTVVDGDIRRGPFTVASLGHLLQFNPMLLLWTAILGVPLLGALWLRLSAVVRRPSGSPVST